MSLPFTVHLTDFAGLLCVCDVWLFDFGLAHILRDTRFQNDSFTPGILQMLFPSRRLSNGCKS
jgi:hypothetical protein